MGSFAVAALDSDDLGSYAEGSTSSSCLPSAVPDDDNVDPADIYVEITQLTTTGSGSEYSSVNCLARDVPRDAQPCGRWGFRESRLINYIRDLHTLCQRVQLKSGGKARGPHT